ncbi:MAG: hypothetical protein WBV74_06570 [Pseudonocardiaceae bacterium]
MILGILGALYGGLNVSVAIQTTLNRVAIQVLQTLGTVFLSRELIGASQVYCVFGLVFGLQAWLYLQAAIVVFCAEINAVRARRLWPRSLLTPFQRRRPHPRRPRLLPFLRRHRALPTLRIGAYPRRPVLIPRQTLINCVVLPARSKMAS